MENEFSEEMKLQLEEDFFKLIGDGKDFRFYLYFSKEMLTDKVTDLLDVFLTEEAFRLIENGKSTPDCFIAYEDDQIKIKLDTTERKLEALDKMIALFESREEYEKCKVIHEFFENIKIDII